MKRAHNSSESSSNSYTRELSPSDTYDSSESSSNSYTRELSPSDTYERELSPPHSSHSYATSDSETPIDTSPQYTSGTTMYKTRYTTVKRSRASTDAPTHRAIQCLEAMSTGGPYYVDVFNAKCPRLNASEQSKVLVMVPCVFRPHSAAKLHTLLAAGWNIVPEDSQPFINNLLSEGTPDVLSVADPYWDRLVANGLDINQEYNAGHWNILTSNTQWPEHIEWLLRHGADPTRKLSGTRRDSIETVQIQLDQTPHDDRNSPMFLGRLESLRIMNAAEQHPIMPPIARLRIK